MQGLVHRYIYKRILEYQSIFPVVAILGPRQCGKSTLAKWTISEDESYIYLDLEKYSDLNKLNDPEFFFRNNQNRNICIDEVQLRPELFTSLRPVIDENRKNGRFLILGSASRDLLKQSSETLAGRIGYLELTPFHLNELEQARAYNFSKHWLRGGFPDSYLQKEEHSSTVWRENYIRTFVERDLPQSGTNIPALTIRRLLTMSAHNQGQILNHSKLGESLGTSYHTVQNHMNRLEQMFMIRRLQPYYPNIKKRIIKSPKVYIRDSGILHSLLNIENMNDLMGNPVFGPSWEGYCIENILSHYFDWTAYFYKTSSGNEIDLILEKGKKRLAIEFKSSSAPKLRKGIYLAMDDLGINKLWVLAPVEESYSLNQRVHISSLKDFIRDSPNK